MSPSTPCSHGRRNCARAGCRRPECLAAASATVQAYKAACRERGETDPSEIPHGTVTGYTNWRCRCELCETAYRDSRRLGSALAEVELVGHRQRWTKAEAVAVLARRPSGEFVIPLTAAAVQFKRTKMAIAMYRRRHAGGV